MREMAAGEKVKSTVEKKGRKYSSEEGTAEEERSLLFRFGRKK